MLKNTEGKEVDTFEQELEYRIANLTTAIDTGHIEKEYVSGMKHGYEYALALYRECRKDGTI